MSEKKEKAKTTFDLMREGKWREAVILVDCPLELDLVEMARCEGCQHKKMMMVNAVLCDAEETIQENDDDV